MGLIYNLLFSASPEKTSGTKAGLRLQEKTSSERYTLAYEFTLSLLRDVLLIYLSTTRWGRIRCVLATKTRKLDACPFAIIYNTYIFVSYVYYEDKSSNQRKVSRIKKKKKKRNVVPSNDLITYTRSSFVCNSLFTGLFYFTGIPFACSAACARCHRLIILLIIYIVDGYHRKVIIFFILSSDIFRLQVRNFTIRYNLKDVELNLFNFSFKLNWIFVINSYGTDEIFLILHSDYNFIY